MKSRGRIRRWARLISACGILVVGAVWLLSARWLVWYAWRAQILTPHDARVCGIGEGGVFYKAFHPIDLNDFRLGAPGWHTAPCAWRWGLTRPSLQTRQFRTDLWFPLWIVFAAVSVPTAIIWIWSSPPRPGHCVSCGYDLTGNKSGRCPECGTPTADAGC